MITHIFTGFDSAWEDKQPGAIASILRNSEGHYEWVEPKLTTFQEAGVEIASLAERTPFHLVAIDQPTIVPNDTGNRPVESVAGAIIGKLKGGVQPANRGMARRFGNEAPIWRFLGALPHVQNPWRAVGGTTGKFLMEVFPALSIPGLIPYFLKRGTGAKYNPTKRGKFSFDDWRKVAEGVRHYGAQNNIRSLAGWACQAGKLCKPSKSDQDMLDAALCTVLAHYWHGRGTNGNIVIGDPSNGYIVAAVNRETETILRSAANKRGAPFNQPWTNGQED